MLPLAIAVAGVDGWPNHGLAGQVLELFDLRGHHHHANVRCAVTVHAYVLIQTEVGKAAHVALQVGTIDGVRDWSEYRLELARLLEAPTSRPPAIGIAVKAAGRLDESACHQESP